MLRADRNKNACIFSIKQFMEMGQKEGKINSEEEIEVFP